MTASHSRSRLRGVAKFALVLVALLMIAVLIFWLLLPGYILSKVNEALKEALAAETHVDSLNLSLHQGRITLYGLRIHQPESYAEGTFLTISRLHLHLDLLSVINPPLEIHEAVLIKPEVNIIKHGDDGFNALQLARIDEQDPTHTGRSILIEQIRIVDGRVSYVDTAYSEGKMRFYLTDLDGRGEQILINPDMAEDSAAQRSSARISGRIRQVPGYDGYVGLIMHAGSIRQGIIPFNSALRIVGLDFALLEAVLPTGTAQVLGGNAADVELNLSLAAEYLNGRAVLTTIGDHKHALILSGTPADINFETSGFFEFLSKRAGGIIGNVTGEIAGVGEDIAGTAGDAAKQAGQGAARVAGSLLGGLLQTAKGVVTADPSEVAEGLGRGTVGTLKEAGETVTGTGRTIGTGAMGAVTLSRDEARQWWQNLPARWQTNWQAADEFVNTAAFPPGPSVRDDESRETSSPQPETDEPGE